MQKAKEKPATYRKPLEQPPPSTEQNARLISAATLAQMLDISLRTLWRLKSGGKLPQPVKLGGSIRWRVGEINEWIAAGCPGLHEWKRNRSA